MPRLQRDDLRARGLEIHRKRTRPCTWRRTHESAASRPGRQMGSTWPRRARSSKFSLARRFMASRSSISTMPLGAEAARGSRCDDGIRRERIRQCASRRSLSLGARRRQRYEAARETVRRFLNAAHADEIVFTQGRHRSDQSRCLLLSRAAHPARRRDRAHHDGAPFQHRALAFPARAAGRGVEMGRCAATTARSMPSAIDAAIGPKTKLVAVAHMSNVLGTVSAAERDRRGARTRRAFPCSLTVARAPCTSASTCRISESISMR